VLAGGGGVGRRRQGRDVGQCEVGQRGVGMSGVRSREVDRAARGRTGDAGSDGWHGRGAHTRGSVGRLDHWVQVMDLSP
jgi:hypothetical protein